MFIFLYSSPLRIMYQGCSQDFSKGRGGCHTVSDIIVMSFSPRNIVGCLLKKRLTEGGVTGTPGPPLATPLCIQKLGGKLAYSSLRNETKRNEMVVYEIVFCYGTLYFST